MDVDSNYSTDVTIRESDEYVRALTSQVTNRKGRGFRDLHVREDVQYEALDSQSSQTGPAKSVQGWILIITNVHPEASEEDISNIFGEFGPLRNIHLNIDHRTGYLQGYVLIEYDSYKEAQKAVEQNGKLQIYGLALGVDWAFSSGPLYYK